MGMVLKNERGGEREILLYQGQLERGRGNEIQCPIKYETEKRLTNLDLTKGGWHMAPRAKSRLHSCLCSSIGRENLRTTYDRAVPAMG